MTASAPRWRSPVLLIAIVIVAIVLVVGGMLLLDPAGRRDLGDSSGVGVSGPVASVAPHKMGEKVKVGGEEYLTVNRVSNWTGNAAVPPAADERFVAVEVTIEGINPDGATFDPNYFHLVDDEGLTYEAVTAGKDPQLQSTHKLAPGTAATGWVTFKVKQSGSALGLSLVYTPTFTDQIVNVRIG